MKKIYSLLIAASIVSFSYGQSLSPSVISSTGGFSSNANFSVSYTVCEMSMIQTFSANGNILTQGFQQPNEHVISLIKMTQSEFGSFVVYPNPAVDNLWFGFQFPEKGKISVSLVNSVGQLVSDVYETNYDSGKMVEPINVSDFAAGVYFLNLHFTSDADGKMHSASKMFQVIK